MPKRRMYSAEFKREAVALANQPGVTKAQIGRANRGRGILGRRLYPESSIKILLLAVDLAAFANVGGNY